MEIYDTETIIGNFRTERYEALNKARWDHFLSMGIEIKDKIIFEPGAGIGDQTEWLLSQGATSLFVNEGRDGNREIIQQRFGNDPRVSLLPGLLEDCLTKYVFCGVDLIFCYGIYYHLRDTFPDFPILGQFSKLGEMMVFDYLAGNDNEYFYGYDNPSTSISQYSFRPRRETMNDALKRYWEFVYEPKEPLIWHDPVATEDRVVAVASHSKLNNPNLIQI